jgi:hypothetical protein
LHEVVVSRARSAQREPEDSSEDEIKRGHRPQ